MDERNNITWDLRADVNILSGVMVLVKVQF